MLNSLTPPLALLALIAPVSLTAPAAVAAPASSNLIADWSNDWDTALEGWKLSGQLTAASDSTSKGISETHGNGQLSGALTATRGKLYVSARYKNYKGSDGSDHQAGFALGGRWVAGPAINLNSQLIYKVNTGARSGSDNDFVEWQTEASRAFGNTTLKALSIWSPDSSGTTKEALYYELGLAQKLSKRLSLSGGIGERRTQPKRNYTAWNAGATVTLNDRTSLDVRYYDTNRHEYSKAHGDRFVVALQRKF